MQTLFVVLISSLLFVGINGAALAAGAAAGGFDLTSSDTNKDTALFPATITQTTGGAAYAYVPTSGGTAQTSSTVTGAPTGPSGTSNAWTVAFKGNSGIPLTTVMTLTAQTTGTAIIGLVVQIPVGPQVALNVVGAATGTGTTDAAGTLQTSASAVSATAATCGSYYVDCSAGILYFQMHIPAVTATTCTVTITQIPAVFGGLAYATTLPTGAQANLATAVTSNSNGSGSPTFCGTLTNSGNTVYLFTQPLATAATTSDVNTAQAKLLAAIKAKTAFTGSARLLEESERVLATSYTLVNGYATALPTSSAAGVVAPSTTASASLAANATSQGRVVVLAGLLTTVLAAIFGFAL